MTAVALPALLLVVLTFAGLAHSVDLADRVERPCVACGGAR